jgi:hypothetical protein
MEGWILGVPGLLWVGKGPHDFAIRVCLDMRKALKPAPITDPARKQAAIYARVFSKEQEKEGFSITAQLKLLKEHASANGFSVALEYVDVETARPAAPPSARWSPISRRIGPFA